MTTGNEGVRRGAQVPEDGTQWDETVDVVVVGSGAGAMTGAYIAADAGASTLVLERTHLLGGTSADSGAACWLPGTQVQSRADVPDSTESARTYLRAVLGDAELEKIDAFVTSAPQLVERLERDPAIVFEWRPFPDYFDAPGRVPGGRSFVPVDLPRAQIGRLAELVRPTVDRDRAGLGHSDGALKAGRALIGRLLLALDGTGRARIRASTRLTSLVVQDGRVVGVEALGPDGPLRVRADRGVLLAAGGFERNAQLREACNVPGSAQWSMAPADTNTGDAITAARDIGADVRLMEEGWWCPGLVQPDGAAAFTLGLRGGLLVDADGVRFANESLPYDRMGRQFAAAPGRIPSYFVFDSRWGGALPAITVPTVAPEACLAAGTWVQASTPAELADAIGVPAATLEETVAHFNAQADAGTDDDHGRGADAYDRFFADGTGPNPALVPLDTPPYYAARVVLSDLGTKGGLCTDTDARVLDEQGAPVPGLYAAGNTAASFTGHLYPGPGAPIGTAMVFAGRAADHMTRSADSL